MSLENVAIVEQAYGALNRHDIDGFLALCGPDVEYVNPDDATEPGVRAGHAAFGRALQSLLDSFDDYRAEPQRLVPIGSQVVAIERSSGRGRASGASFEAVHAHLFTLADGKIVRFAWFRDPTEALEAAGIEEQAN